MARSNNSAGDGAQAEGFGVYDFAVTDAEQVVARDDPPDDDQDTVNETDVSDQQAVAESSSNLSGAVGDVVTDNTGVVAASQLMDVLTGGDQAAAASPDFDIRDLVNDAEVDRVSDAFNKETDQQIQQAIVQDLMARSEPAGISLITQRSAEGWGATEDGIATDGKTPEAFASWGTQVNDMGERYNRFSESVINPLRNAAESNLARVGV